MEIGLIIFSFISMIILIPISYFLPLKITPKGKILIVAISFLISMVGLFTTVFLALWQSILMMIALVLLLTLILSKRFSPFLFSLPDKSSIKIDHFEFQKEKKKDSDYLEENLAPLSFKQQNVENVSTYSIENKAMDPDDQLFMNDEEINQLLDDREQLDPNEKMVSDDRLENKELSMTKR